MLIATDAGQQGYGGVFGKQWFYGKWSADEEEQSQRSSRDSMPWKELHTLSVPLPLGVPGGRRPTLSSTWTANLWSLLS